MNFKTMALSAIFLLSGSILASISEASGTTPPRDSSQYNLIQGVGAQTYDPVAYFPEGGAQPQPGNSSLSVEYKGVSYHFSSEKNRATFNSSPSKYEPAYGGWCSLVMKNAVKDIVDARFFIVSGNRLFLFHNSEARDLFARDVAKSSRQSDSGWKQISGENPRR